jgi:hypothetical protein
LGLGINCSISAIRLYGFPRMNLPNAQRRAVARTVDDGGPIVIAIADKGETQRGSLAISTTFCTSAECPCRNMTLAARELEMIGGGMARIVDSSGCRAKFYVDTAGLAWCLKRGCRCDKFRIVVLRAGGKPIGMIQVSTRDWRALGVECNPPASLVRNDFMRERLGREMLQACRRARCAPAPASHCHRAGIVAIFEISRTSRWTKRFLPVWLGQELEEVLRCIARTQEPRMTLP